MQVIIIGIIFKYEEQILVPIIICLMTFKYQQVFSKRKGLKLILMHDFYLSNIPPHTMSF